ncbi:catalase family protein [Singulisphaera sp. PoT]|uniref:catalase family protein n=1 Tax=Singulisphaera sp. PoT TaxID=3411797 RepID=UPI003BF5E29E
MSGNEPHLGLGEERAPEGEEAMIARIVEIQESVTDKSARPVPRGQHMKGHGCVKAEFIVEPGLPPTLAHGIFEGPRTFPAYIRFSNGAARDDRKADVHGMAIKLLDVHGAKLLEDEPDARTQDFILIDHPVFFIRDVADYVPFMEDFRRLKGGFGLGKLMVIGKALLSSDYRWSIARETLSKKPESPLRTSYWSTTPYRLGATAAKYSVTPDLAGAPAVVAFDSPDKLRLAMAAQLGSHEARFNFLVQLQADPITMPVEDPTIPWDAPWQKVATIRIPPQTFDTPDQMTFCENLSFTPWHSLPDHRPLGGINRARKAVYREISRQRHELNGVAREEPTA